MLLPLRSRRIQHSKNHRSACRAVGSIITISGVVNAQTIFRRVWGLDRRNIDAILCEHFAGYVTYLRTDGLNRFND